jgi:hypothetical protein
LWDLLDLLALGAGLLAHLLLTLLLHLDLALHLLLALDLECAFLLASLLLSLLLTVGFRGLLAFALSFHLLAARIRFGLLLTSGLLFLLPLRLALTFGALGVLALFFHPGCILLALQAFCLLAPGVLFRCGLLPLQALLPLNFILRIILRFLAFAVAAAQLALRRVRGRTNGRLIVSNAVVGTAFLEGFAESAFAFAIGLVVQCPRLGWLFAGNAVRFAGSSVFTRFVRPIRSIGALGINTHNWRIRLTIGFVAFTTLFRATFGHSGTIDTRLIRSGARIRAA